MYLYGYSSQQIADTLNTLGRKSYLGNVNWTSNGVVQVLRNERHCGDVITRKTYTISYRTHKSAKNRGERPQSTYHKHHEAIVSRDDFIAVQRMLDNAKYKNKSFLPELRVIDSGILKGFVVINPRWAGFKEGDYFNASQSAYIEDENDVNTAHAQEEIKIEVEAGDFDLRGFEITRSEFFDSVNRPCITFSNNQIMLNTECVRKLGEKNYIELLINPIERKFAIRTTAKSNRQAVICSKVSQKIYYTKPIPSAAFQNTVFSLFGWNTDCKYRIIGSRFEKDNEIAYIFDVSNSEAFFKSYVLSSQEATEAGTVSIQPYTPSGKRIRAIPKEWTSSFGKPYYLHEQTLAALDKQSESDWKIRMEGQLYETGKKINVTPFDELRRYIKKELNGVMPQEKKTNE